MPEVTVTLSLGDSPYQARLPRVLQEGGMLRRVLRFCGGLEVLEPQAGSLRCVRSFGEYRMANRVLWGSWRRLPGRRRSKLPQVASAWLADRLMARYAPGSTIFHGITTLSLACLRAAGRRGAITVVENTVQHPKRWQREVLAECTRFGVHPRDCDNVLPETLVRRMEREYELCDAIVVRSSCARRGFQDYPCGSKAVTVLAGVDHEFFVPAGGPPETFRVLYAGRVELAKGVPYLLQAWNRLHLKDAELVLAGEVRPEMERLLPKEASESVKILGFVPAAEVRREYQRASALVLPSVNEGLGRVMLEAMSSGVPVLATDKAGAEDCVTDGKTGFILPARDVNGLAEALLWCYRHREQACEMGKAGRAAALEKFTLDHYEQRQIGLYRFLAGQQPLTGVAPSAGGRDATTSRAARSVARR